MQQNTLPISQGNRKAVQLTLLEFYCLVRKKKCCLVLIKESITSYFSEHIYINTVLVAFKARTIASGFIWLLSSNLPPWNTPATLYYICHCFDIFKWKEIWRACIPWYKHRNFLPKMYHVIIVIVPAL